MLKNTLEPRLTEKRCVIYLDELPCFDTPKSGFIRALGHFWNTWASLHKQVILIVCGSATSWMVENIINEHGGLHNRITQSIYLRQFNLHEVECYFSSRGMAWTKQTVLETYMIFGGIPYYLSLLNPLESLPQNIDRLYFAENGELSHEYHRLYASLFRSPEQYIRIVETLAKHKHGLTRGDIARLLNIPSSGSLSKQLDNLVNCEMVRSYVTKVKGRIKRNDSYYQLIDLFSLFHLSFVKKKLSNDFWQQRLNTPSINTWQGLAFEHVCMLHIEQIRRALGLERIAVEYYSWRSQHTPKNQVDMIIERADRLINLCEIKYSQSEYTITAADDRSVRQRMESFKTETNTNCGVIPTWITVYGLHKNPYSSIVQYQVILNDLFAKVP